MCLATPTNKNTHKVTAKYDLTILSSNDIQPSLEDVKKNKVFILFLSAKYPGFFFFFFLQECQSDWSREEFPFAAELKDIFGIKDLVDKENQFLTFYEQKFLPLVKHCVGMLNSEAHLDHNERHIQSAELGGLTGGYYFFLIFCHQQNILLFIFFWPGSKYIFFNKIIIKRAIDRQVASEFLYGGDKPDHVAAG